MQHLTIWKYIYIVLFLLFGVQSATIRAEKRNFTLVIDAGHGGHDAGAVGAYSKEKNINLAVALAFGRLVEANCPDVKVIYTRKRDVFIPLQRRADIANENSADLFISIHTNALPKGRIAYGSETYSLGMARAAANLEVAKRENAVITLEDNYQKTYKGFNPNRSESYVIFEIMQDRYMKQSVDMACCIQKQYKSNGRPDKGVHQAGFLVLRNTTMPSVLTELGFITTPEEEKYLNSASGQAELSRSIYNGFLSYRRLHDRKTRDLPAALPNIKDTAAQITDNSPETGKELAVVPVKVVKTADLPSRNVRNDNVQTVKLSKPADEGDVRKTMAETAERPKTTTKRPKNEVKKPVDKKPNASKNTTAVAAKKNTAKKKPVKKGPSVTYRIQVSAGKRDVSVKDPQFKGLAVTRVKEGNLYKFFYGNYSHYAEAYQAMKTVQKKMPGSYLVAYINGKQVTVPEARAAEKKK